MKKCRSVKFPPPTFSGSYDDAGIRVLHCNVRSQWDWDFPDLTAPYWRFYWNEDDGGVVLHGGQATTLQAGRFYLIPPETTYASQGYLDFSHFYIHFTAKPPFDTAVPGIYEIPAGPDNLAYASTTLALTIKNIGSRPDALLQMRYNALVCHALSLLPKESVERVPQDARITRVIAYMEENLSRKIPTKELAGVAHISPQSLFRLFKQELDSSPQDYFKKLKIKQACFDLHFTEMTIDEIALSLGFADRYHFTKVFSAFRYIPPAAYRKLNQSH